MSLSAFELAHPSNSLARPARLDGYPSFAYFIARDADAAIYRKYAHLSARNLLYLQSELHELEEQLQQLDGEDAKHIDDELAQKAARYWTHYSDPDNARACQHRSLQEKIRLKLREYHEALLLENRVLALAPPKSRTLKGFRKWFISKTIPVLWGQDQNLFTDERDLVALAPVETDRLDIFLQSYFSWFFKEKQQPESGDDTYGINREIFYYPQRRIERAGAVLSVLFSAILLIGAIVCLLLVSDRSINIRVGLIVLFISLFALVVGLLTNARRAEIFGATAAYAAVLVVFVSNDFGNSIK
ncbi:hypothetical protein HO173_011820 [Letharia columbiana]|uniref:DUF6594 domain-containing protein n=1 Tax=Letharia columbiana TaxID=112416 RepID=A0A8H6CRL0_9LECA|nr:uncharacterized protein HO173_011820 [Letharia columbiana]KAF6228585.1 hypothetical protein HO173_011820 [Letharia columbiana]